MTIIILMGRNPKIIQKIITFKKSMCLEFNLKQKAKNGKQNKNLNSRTLS